MLNQNQNGDSKWSNKIETLLTTIKELEEKREKVNKAFLQSQSPAYLEEIDKIDEAIKVAEDKVCQLQKKIEKAKQDKSKVKKDIVQPKASKVKAVKGEVQVKAKTAKPKDCTAVTASICEDVAVELQKCESIIEKNLKSFVEVGIALRKIKEEELFRPKDDSFEQYLQRRWSSRDWGMKLMKGSKIAKNIDNCLHLQLNECQARALHPIHKDAKAQETVIKKALKLAGESKLTNQHIKSAVDKHLKKNGKTRTVKKLSVEVKKKSVSNQVTKFSDMVKKIFNDYDSKEIAKIFKGNLKSIKSIIEKVEKASAV